MSDDLGAKLSRWSQRKLAARRGTEVPREDDQPSAPEGARAPVPAEDAAASEETPVLPPIDELTAESDYTVFLGKNVPQALTNAALRKLWLSDPVFANLDRLNDYDDDYSFVEGVISAVKTSYRVGKGHVDEAEEAVAKLETSDAHDESAAEKKEARAGASTESSSAGDEASSDTVGNNAAPEDKPGAAPRQPGATKLGGAQRGQMEDKDN